jgi:predicted nucleic acid-binding protein
VRDVAAPDRVFVDTGAWIALRVRRDQYHVEADRLFHEAVRRGMSLVTTNLVIAEVHRLTLFRLGFNIARRTLDLVDASRRTTIHFAGSEDHKAARKWLQRLAPRPVTYTDAVSFAVMEATGCRDVLGFDADFAAAGFTLWRG